MSTGKMETVGDFQDFDAEATRVLAKLPKEVGELYEGHMIFFNCHCSLTEVTYVSDDHDIRKIARNIALSPVDVVLIRALQAWLETAEREYAAICRERQATAA